MAENQHHCVFCNPNRRSAERDGERDAPLGKRRRIDSVVIANALVVDEGKLTAGLDQRPGEGFGGDNDRIRISELLNSLAVVIALKTNHLAAPCSRLADHGVESRLTIAVVKDALHPHSST